MLCKHEVIGSSPIASKKMTKNNLLQTFSIFKKCEILVPRPVQTLFVPLPCWARQGRILVCASPNPFRVKLSNGALLHFITRWSMVYAKHKPWTQTLE